MINEYIIETKNRAGRWTAIPGAIFRATFADGTACHYAAGGARAAAVDAVQRLTEDPDSGRDAYRIRLITR